MRVFKILFLFLFLSSLTYSQTMEEVTFSIVPSSSFLKIDTLLIDLKSKPNVFIISLEPGIYPLQIWEEKYQLFYDTLIVEEEGKRNIYTKGLTTLSESFNQYKEEFRTYRRTKQKNLALGSLFLGTTALGLNYVFSGEKKQIEYFENSLKLHENAYFNSVSPVRIEQAKSAYEQTQGEYHDLRKKVYLRRLVGIPIIVGSSYIFYKFYKKREKAKKPRFFAPNPLTFDEINLNSNDNAILALSLNLSF